MPFHANEELGSIHIPHQWAYADAAERTAAVGFVSTDLHKLALQLDDMTFWVVSAIVDEDTPVTWVQVGGSGNDTWVAAPAAPNSAGIAGQRAYDADGFLYVCIATNTWVRYAGSTWTP